MQAGPVERVVAALKAAGIEPRLFEDPKGLRTAQETADAVGAQVGAVVKSLVFLLDDEPVLILTSGARRVDPQALGQLLGGTLRRADPDTVRRATGYPIGGVPPVGHATPLRVFADPALLRHREVWAGAGRPEVVFAAEPQALLRAAGAELLPHGVFVDAASAPQPGARG